MAIRSALLASLSSAAANTVFTLPDLSYGVEALEPHFDTLTMQVHHDKHHAAYVAGLNKAVEGKSLKGDAQSLADFQSSAAENVATRNHGGGHYNHALFWVNLAPADKSSVDDISPELMGAIKAAFGGVEKMQEEFTKQAVTRFGSGWSWLGVSKEGGLGVTSTANQDNPLMEHNDYQYQRMVPILGLDVWEHAYYLKYQNRRPDYIKAFWNVVNWKKVSRNFALYASKGLAVPPTTTGTGFAIIERDQGGRAVIAGEL